MDYSRITSELKEALQELFVSALLKKGDILVVGCSTSEILGEKIGTATSLEAAQAVIEGIYPLCQKREIFVAIQCCEHLNRALVVEKECLSKYQLEEVSVFPVPGAGGSTAHLAMKTLLDPVVVEKIQAHAGIDIGDTFIGMHLKPVAVPVRSKVKKIGNAHLTMARTRPKLIGGQRAQYEQTQEEFINGLC